jgi:hypothetical protein
MALAMGGNLFLYGAAPAAASRTATQNEASEQSDDTQNASLIASASAAKNYVDALDRGEYAQSWSGSDPIFQKTISQEEWKNYLERVRKQLGKTVSRKMKHQGQAWNPKGLPEGAYMVVSYDTSFQNLPNIEELITLRQGPDQKWRVLTYEIKQ